MNLELPGLNTGRLSEEECAEVPPEFHLERHDLKVTGTDQRTLAIIRIAP